MERAYDTLLDNGFKFRAGWCSFTVRQTRLGALLYVGKEMLDLKIDEEAIKENPLLGSYQLAVDKHRTAAKVVAYSILNRKWKIKRFGKLLTNYLLGTLTPQKLSSIVMAIIVLNNVSSFANSIRLIHTLHKMEIGLIEKS